MNYNDEDENDEKELNKVEEAAPKYGSLLSIEEYLEWEEGQEEKHEFIDGEIFTMQGASLDHNQIFMNLMEKILDHLKDKKCRMFASDLKIFVEAQNSILYPDATIFCDDLEESEKHKNCVTNPAVIFEILSPSTRIYDLAKKHLIYSRLKSFKEYILIDSTKMSILSKRRYDEDINYWIPGQVYLPEHTLSIKAIDLQIPLSEIYKNVKF